MDPLSSSSTSGIGNGINFELGAGPGPKAKYRARPRLVKLRKHGGKVRGADSGEACSGFNPFTSSGSIQINKVDSRHGDSIDNTCFVFGGNGSEATADTSSNHAQVNTSSSDAKSDKDKGSTHVGDSDLGSGIIEEPSDGKQNIGTCSGSCESGIFVFGSSKKDDKDGKENSGALKDRAKETDCKSSPDTCEEPISNLHDDLRKLNISNTNDINSGGCTEEVNIAHNKAAFVFGNKATTPSGSCSSSSNGFHQTERVVDDQPYSHTEEINVNNSTSTCFGASTSSDNFEVPQWSPSSLKNSLFPELNKYPEGYRKIRTSKDKRSKKVREKINQKKHNLPQDHQEKLNSPGYCSPMDFSPYDNDKKASSQIPTEAPPPSIKLFDARDHESSGSTFSTEDHKSHCMPLFPLSSGLEDDKGFAFSASSSQGQSLIKKRQTQKTFRRKVNKNLLKKDPTATTFSSQSKKEDAAQNKNGIQPESKVQSKQDPVMPSACEMWRLRGNQAYRNGDLYKAEECYTQGIKSVPAPGSSEYILKPLALCYGNRAATRISLGRLREAIQDCKTAASLDPTFIKAYMRAANCYLVLGELGEALQYFNKCTETASSVCLDRRAIIEAAEGLQKAQRVTDCASTATKLLEKRTPDAASEALSPIADALSISSCSEDLFRMKAEALFMVQRYKEVIEVCEHTLHVVERNLSSNNLGSKHQSPAVVWRWNIVSKSHFFMGNFETALDILQKLQLMESSCDKNQEEILESSASLASTISELLRYKNAGNEAVRAGRYAEAVEHYTAALSRNIDSRPFAAICFCNRAAANQALVQIADAIADCSLAIALDADYTKAISRRVTLHEMIRDYDQAASDLRRLISFLEKQCDGKEKSSETSSGRGSSMKELKQARQRLSVIDEESKKGIPLDFFLILGVKKSDAATDIKKAYRKAALRHHPDKAGQILVRGESEGLWLKEIVQEVHKDADRLFKTIGEAYSVLSDPSKRSEYEVEEEVRKARAAREDNKSRGNRRSYSYASEFPFPRSPNRQNWRDGRRAPRNKPEGWWDQFV